MKSFLDSVLTYLMGLFLAYILNIILYSVGVIGTDVTWYFKGLFVPFFAAIVGWTLIFSIRKILVFICEVLMSWTIGLELLLATLLAGYLALTCAKGILPEGMITLSGEEAPYFLVGVAYVLVGLFSKVSLPETKQEMVGSSQV